MKIFAITRPRSSIKKSKKILKKHGYKPRATPTIQLYPEYTEEFEKLKNNIMNGETDILILTSQNGVKYFFEGIPNKKQFKKQLNKIEVYAIGPKTQKAIQKHNVESKIPEKYSSKGLVKHLGNQAKDKNIEIARSNHGSPELSNGLEKHGASVHDVPIYRVGMPRDTSEIKNLIQDVNNKKIDIIGFTSQMTVKNYMEIAEKNQLKDQVVDSMNQITVAAIGKPTQEILREYGVKEVIAPENYLFKEMVKEVKKMDEEKK